MSGTRSKSLTAALAEAAEALDAGRFFEAERTALGVLENARQASDFSMMAEAIPTLKAARKERVAAALKAGDGRIRHLEARPEEDESVEPGCYLVEPPLVGADARALRLAGLEQEVPVVTVCREPLTQMNLRPIVAIGRITVRARVLPADEDANPDLDWFLSSMNEIGETAIDSLDSGAAILKQIDGLMDRLDSIPDHERLHDVLEELCRIASSAEESD